MAVVQLMRRSRTHRFCQALHAETGGRMRFSTIAAVAKRLGISEEEAIVLAGDCAAAGLVRLDVKGPPYRQLPGHASLSEAGRRVLTPKSDKRRH